MSRVGLVCLGVVFAVVLASHGQSEDAVKKLRSTDAKKALADYDRALKQAQDAYDRDTEGARKKLLTDLGAAQAAAARANQLDEAV